MQTVSITVFVVKRHLNLFFFNNNNTLTIADQNFGCVSTVERNCADKQIYDIIWHFCVVRCFAVKLTYNKPTAIEKRNYRKQIM